MKRICIWTTIWIVTVGSLYASEISYAPLTNVVKEAQWIFKAKVVTVTRKDTQEANRVEYVVVPTTVLIGHPVVREKVTLTYVETIPLIKDAQGKPIGWASPIYSGSGNEFSVKANEEWIFLLVANRLSETRATSILRTEPVSKETEIRRIRSKSAVGGDGKTAPQP
jgi:hypothetical protein